ncbi:MAG: DNA-deoxyinosine glycosylase [Burkholderiales bacterium]|nr:DNA-deoxyinosine glycosylase [Burkholderiales bacterium]
MKLQGLPPVWRADTEVVVLGSFPGAASLAAAQYYAHPRNQFWRLLEQVLGEPLTALPYEARLERVLSHRVGIWDVLAACRREGSLDTAIREATPNDFEWLHAHAPRLRKLCFNGKTAGRFAPKLAAAGYATLVMPSSSPAHAALTFEQKLREWQHLLA